MRFKLMAAACALMLTASIFAAQEAAPAEKSHATSAKEMKPVDETLKPLSFFEGRWKVSQSIKAHDGMAATSSDGTFMVKPGLEGRALMGKFHGQMGSKPFQGVMLITAEMPQKHTHGQVAKTDGKPQAFSIFWADSEGITSLSRNVSFDGTKLMAVASDPQGSKQGTARVTWTKAGNDKLEYTMERMSEKGWENLVTATYTRTDENPTDVKYDADNKK